MNSHKETKIYIEEVINNFALSKRKLDFALLNCLHNVLCFKQYKAEVLSFKFFTLRLMTTQALGRIHMLAI